MEVKRSKDMLTLKLCNNSCKLPHNISKTKNQRMLVL